MLQQLEEKKFEKPDSLIWSIRNSLLVVSLSDYIVDATNEIGEESKQLIYEFETNLRKTRRRDEIDERECFEENKSNSIDDDDQRLSISLVVLGKNLR